MTRSCGAKSGGSVVPGNDQAEIDQLHLRRLVGEGVDRGMAAVEGIPKLRHVAFVDPRGLQRTPRSRMTGHDTAYQPKR